MMLCGMAFQVPGKVFALHLNTDTARAYLCTHRVVSFSLQTGLLDI